MFGCAGKTRVGREKRPALALTVVVKITAPVVIAPSASNRLLYN
jgi:hypothetical protein